MYASSHYVVGAELSRPKGLGLISHKGVALPGWRVLHNTPLRGEHISSFEDFAQGEQVTAVPPVPGTEVATVIRCLRIAANPRPYSFASWNCEHTVSVAKGLPPASQQLLFWGCVLGVSVLLAKSG